MEKKLYRQTTVGYWFCMFVTNSLSRRTVLQINLRQLHSHVPLGTQAFQLPQAASKAKVGTMMLQMWHETKECVVEFVHQRHGNKPGTMMPCMTSLPNKGAQTQLWIGNVYKLEPIKKKVNAVNDSGPKTSSIS